MRKKLLLTAASMALMAGAAQAQVVPDPLLGFCWGNATCTAFGNNGSNTIDVTGANPPDFGFNISPGGLSGDYQVIVLVPTNEDAAPATLEYVLHETSGGLANNQTSDTGTPTELVSSTPWTSGTLEQYLNNGATPANPIGNYLGTNVGGTNMGGANNGDPTATGYFVYRLDLGQNTLSAQSAGPAGVPELSFDTSAVGTLPASSTLPEGSIIVGYLLNASNGANLATANSESLLVDQQAAPTGVPEPASMAVFGVSLIGLALARARRLNS